MSKATAREQARDNAQEISDLANLIRSANNGVADRLGFRQVVVARPCLAIDKDIVRALTGDYFGVPTQL